MSCSREAEPVGGIGVRTKVHRIPLLAQKIMQPNPPSPNSVQQGHLPEEHSDNSLEGQSCSAIFAMFSCFNKDLT